MSEEVRKRKVEMFMRIGKDGLARGGRKKGRRMKHRGKKRKGRERSMYIIVRSQREGGRKGEG